MTPQQWKECLWDRRHICSMQVIERMVYDDLQKPCLKFDRLALVHQDGTVLYEGSTDKGDTYASVSNMMLQIVLHA